VLDRLDPHGLTCSARSHLDTSPRTVHQYLQRKGVRFKPDASRQLRHVDARSDSQGQLQKGAHNSLRVRACLALADLICALEIPLHLKSPARSSSSHSCRTFTFTFACTCTCMRACTFSPCLSPLTRSIFNRGVGGGEPNDNWEDVCCLTANQCETDADCGEQTDPEKVGRFAPNIFLYVVLSHDCAAHSPSGTSKLTPVNAHRCLCVASTAWTSTPTPANPRSPSMRGL
jgi:hypothetical protein